MSLFSKAKHRGKETSDRLKEPTESGTLRTEGQQERAKHRAEDVTELGEDGGDDTVAGRVQDVKEQTQHDIQRDD